MIRDFIVGLILLIGSTSMLFAALGLTRFADALCRAHALAKATTFGICAMLIALIIALGDELAGLKLLLVVVFSLLTIPMASHLIALLVYRRNQTRKAREEK